MQVSTCNLESCVVVAISGEVDLATAEEMRTQLMGVVDQQPRTVIVDLEGLAFIDSTGLSALVDIWSDARQLGVDVRLAAPQPSVSKVLRITALNDVIGVFPSVEAARGGGAEAPPGV